MNKVELIEKLKQMDEITVLELLEINSSDLIDAFVDKVDDKADYIRGQLEDTEQ